MTNAKLIVVLGATGNQGGSVVETFLNDPTWKVRGVTRNQFSAKAQSLLNRGMEVVQADMNEPDSLSAAFKDANALFAVSDFWGIYNDPANKDKAKPGQPLNLWAASHEKQQLINVIDAAAKVPSLERFVLSSLSDATRWSKGKYTHVYHFDMKAQAAYYGAEKYPDLWAKTSIYQAGWFLNNFTTNPILQPERVSGSVSKLVNPPQIQILI